MRYDFEQIIDRVGKDALAFDVDVAIETGMLGSTDVQIKEGFSPIPMWVADMSFATAPSVQRELQMRVQHPCYGYFQPTDAYFDAIISWQRSHNAAADLKREHIGYENGVLGGVSSSLHVLAAPGDPILIHAPTYIGFSSVLKRGGYQAVASQLTFGDDGIWRMGLADMEDKIVRLGIHTAILCSPHNPTGRVWTREELTSAYELFRKYDVKVISDEIWSDLLLDGHEYVAPQSLSEDARMRTIALYAPSKTFNLAGLVGSYSIIYDPWLAAREHTQAALSHYNSLNVLSMHALIGAYSPDGAEWVNQLRAVLSQNARIAYKTLSAIDGLQLARPEGTYMLFVDCEDWCEKYGISIDELHAKGIAHGVLWQDGRAFGGDATIRMNLALPTVLLQEALNRLLTYVFT